MAGLDDRQRWALMIWQAHSHARRGELREASTLLDLVQLEAGERRDRSEGASASAAVAAFHAAVELRQNLLRP